MDEQIRDERLVTIARRLWRAEMPNVTVSECERKVDRTRAHLTRLMALDEAGWRAENTRDHMRYKVQNWGFNEANADRRTELSALATDAAALRSTLDADDNYLAALDELIAFFPEQTALIKDETEPKKQSTERFKKEKLREAEDSARQAFDRLVACRSAWKAYYSDKARLDRLRELLAAQRSAQP